MAEPNPIDFYREKCSQVKRQLTSMLEFFNSDEIESFDESDLSVRIDAVNGMQAEFVDAQTALEKLDLEMASNTRRIRRNLFQG